MMNRPLRICLLALALASSLSACGLQGELTRPDPLWGTPDDIPAAERNDQRVTDGITDLREAEKAEDEDTAPDPEDELLGGPSRR